MFLDRYVETPGMRVALDLANDLVVAPTDPSRSVEKVFAFDPTSVADRPREHVRGLIDLARELHGVFAALDDGRTADGATVLNGLLAAAPPVPHLVLELPTVGKFLPLLWDWLRREVVQSG